MIILSTAAGMEWLMVLKKTTLMKKLAPLQIQTLLRLQNREGIRKLLAKAKRGKKTKETPTFKNSHKCFK